MLHEEFLLNQHTNDIALLRLDKRLSETKSLSQICLPDQYLKTDLTNCTVLDWSFNDNKSLDSNYNLLSISVQLSPDKCKTISGNFNMDNMICLDPHINDSCVSEDNFGGNPIVCLVYGTNQLVLESLVTYGKKCKQSIGPLIKIRSNLDWIIKYSNVPKINSRTVNQFDNSTPIFTIINIVLIVILIILKIVIIGFTISSASMLFNPRSNKGF